MRTKFFNIYYDVSNLFHICYNKHCNVLAVGEPSKKHPLRTPENKCSPEKIKDLNDRTITEMFKRISTIDNEFRLPKGMSYLILDSKDEELNKSSSTRKLISNEYKKDRKKQSDNFYSLLKHITFILSNLDESYVVVTRPSFEADDLVQPLLEDAKVYNKYTPTLFISNDMDWARAVDHDTIHILMDHKVYDLNKVSERLGIDPSINRVTMYKMLFGDKSDGIFTPTLLKGTRKANRIDLINDLTNPRELLSLTKNRLKEYPESLVEKLLNKSTLNELADNFAMIDSLEFDGDIKDYCTYGCFRKEILIRYFKGLDINPEKIRRNLSTKLGWTDRKPFKFGMKLSRS